LSYTRLLCHIVFATKNRAPLIDDAWAADLCAYLAGAIRGIGGHPLEINAVQDHVHMLVDVKAVIALSEFMSKLKANSSAWAKAKRKGFSWQPKYGAFSVSESQVEIVRKYIRNQQQHHRKMAFDDEFRKLLRAHGIEFEEEHLWT